MVEEFVEKHAYYIQFIKRLSSAWEERGETGIEKRQITLH